MIQATIFVELTVGPNLLPVAAPTEQYGADETFFPGRSAKIFYRPPTSSKPQSIQLVDPDLETAPDPLPDPEVVAQNAEASNTTSRTSVADKLRASSEAVTKAFTSSAARDIEIGHLGILHPSVLRNFEIDAFACSALEIDLEPFL